MLYSLKGIVTKYIQFDEMETFEHGKDKLLGIELSIRAKTGQIIATKVCRIHIKGLTLSPQKKAEYNSKTNREIKFREMMLEVGKVLDEGHTVLSCDGDKQCIMLAKIMCPNNLIKIHINDYDGMWRLNHTCAKLSTIYQD